MPLVGEAPTSKPTISVVEADDGATVIEAFPDEVYLAFLDGRLTSEQFVARLVSHVKRADSPSPPGRLREK